MTDLELQRYVGGFVFITLDGAPTLSVLGYDPKREGFYLKWQPGLHDEGGGIPFMDLTQEQIAGFTVGGETMLYSKISIWSQVA